MPVVCVLTELFRQMELQELPPFHLIFAVLGLLKIRRRLLGSIDNARQAVEFAFDDAYLRVEIRLELHEFAFDRHQLCLRFDRRRGESENL